MGNWGKNFRKVFYIFIDFVDCWKIKIKTKKEEQEIVKIIILQNQYIKIVPQSTQVINIIKFFLK